MALALSYVVSSPLARAEPEPQPEPGAAPSVPLSQPTVNQPDTLGSNRAEAKPRATREAASARVFWVEQSSAKEGANAPPDSCESLRPAAAARRPLDPGTSISRFTGRFAGCGASGSHNRVVSGWAAVLAGAF